MASVSLHDVWLNDGSDGSDRLCVRYAGSLSRTPAVPGSTIRLAGGQVRSIAQAGRTTQWQVSSPNASADQVVWVTEHTGTPVWVRDPWGNRVKGIYWSATLTPNGYDCTHDVSITVDEITAI